GPETRAKVHSSHGEGGKLTHNKKQKVEDKSHEGQDNGAPKSATEKNGKLISQNFDEFKKLLGENVSVDELRQILRENEQDVSGSDESVIERCAAQLIHGPLEACGLCGGSLELSGGSYKCMGFISEWSKCCFSTRDPPRSNAKCKIPSGIKNEFIKEWSQKYQDSSSRPKRELPAANKPFSGMTIALAGRMSRPQYVWRQEIEKHGGRVSNVIREGVKCVVAPDVEVERGGSSKLADATDNSIPLVREAWLHDSIEKAKAEPLEAYNMIAELPGGPDIPWAKRVPEEEASESLMAELKLYGKRGVYKDTGLQESGGYILERDGILFNCAFSVCDQAIDLRDYCIMQIIVMPKDDNHYLYFKRGRVGDQMSIEEQLDERTNVEETIKEFSKLFEELTGNEFEPWEREKKLSKKRLKLYPIDMVDGVDVRYGGLGVRQVAIAATHTKLDPRVAGLFKILFSQEVYRYAMTEMAIDVPDLPMGMVTDVHLKRCEEVLLEFAEQLSKKSESEDKREALCLDFSNKWFTLLHSTRPFVIHELQQLADLAAPTLESVRDICFASQIIGDMTGSTLDDPLTDRYLKLDCAITPLDKGAEDYNMILKYLSKTFEPIQYRDGSFGVVVDSIYKVDGRAPSYQEVAKMPNKVLLWCGTRTSNLLRHIKQGFMPAIFSAPAPGYMFGRGIYCTDAAAKAAMYGFTAVDIREGFLILAVASLGEKIIEMATAPQDTKKLEEENVAVKGVGKKTTDESEYFTWKDDIKVPCGTLIPSEYEDSSLAYNEYVVYNPKQ
ncbi:hypothetical protein KI387_018613, partial [Taxus chinensis]